MGISADFVQSSSNNTSYSSSIGIHIPLENYIVTQNIDHRRSGGIADILNENTGVEKLVWKDWVALGFTKKQAVHLVGEFQRGKIARDRRQWNTVFYERNSHVYIDSDFRDVLCRLFSRPDLDTHSCARANFGPKGVNARMFYGPEYSHGPLPMGGTDGYVQPWGPVPKQVFPFDVDNPKSFKCFSNPPYGHGGACKKFCAKTIFEYERHTKIFEQTNECYEHIVIISTARSGHDEESYAEWFKKVKKNCLLWFRVKKLLFRVPRATNQGFDPKIVKPNRTVVFMYMAIGPQEWINRRVDDVRTIFDGHFRDRYKDETDI